MRIFLLKDAVGCAVEGRQLSDGHHRPDRMLVCAARHGAGAGCCGPCMDACGVTEDALVEGVRRATLDGLTG